jgi:shikimate dehydrogenase
MAHLRLNWRYLAFDTCPEHLREAIVGAKAMRFIGLNLTVPHKLAAVHFVDMLDNSAKTWGAVNTIRFEGCSNGRWKSVAALADKVPDRIRSVGFNTDADAITRDMEERFGHRLKGIRVLVLGAGGAARVAALKLASEGVHSLFLVNRTLRRAKEIAEAVRRTHPGVNAIVGYPKGPVDLVVNATSLGLRSNDPLPLDCRKFQLKHAGAVYDMIYRPAETALLKSARAAGCKTANGLGMLLFQGAAAFELWTGRNAPLNVMRQALEENIYES